MDLFSCIKQLEETFQRLGELCVTKRIRRGCERNRYQQPSVCRNKLLKLNVCLEICRSGLDNLQVCWICPLGLRGKWSTSPSTASCLSRQQWACVKWRNSQRHAREWRGSLPFRLYNFGKNMLLAICGVRGQDGVMQEGQITAVLYLLSLNDQLQM